MNYTTLSQRSCLVFACACAGLSIDGAIGATATPKSAVRPPADRVFAKARKPAIEATGRLPLYFEPNVGQADPAVRFICRGGGFTTFLTGAETVFTNSGLSQPLRLKFLNAAASTAAEPAERIPGISNYFHGRDSKKWRTDVPHFAKVKFRRIYDGVDVVFYSGEKRVEYDFVVAPGADAGQIAFAWEGADDVRLDKSGDLILSTSAGEIRQRRPFVYQEIAGARVAIEARYLIDRNHKIRFELAAWNRGKPLVIDPQIFYGAFIGGSAGETATSITADASGSVYITGTTGSTNFPRFNAYQSEPQGGTDAFVTKVSVDGISLVYSTFLGGEQEDYTFGIAADAQGNAYVTGLTTSFVFPITQNAFQEMYSGTQDAFVTKLTPFGNAILYSTYMGTGDTFEIGYSLTVDRNGNAVVVGTTNSTTLAVTTNAFDKTANGGLDIFVLRLADNGRAAIFLSYLGGNLNETPYAVTLDFAGEILVAGDTSSANFPVTAGAYDTTFGGAPDGFFAKITQSGDRLVFASFVGGSGGDAVRAIAVEPGGRILLAGDTSSTNFPTTPNAYQSSNRGGFSDAFVCRFNSTGNVLIASSLLGTFSRDSANGVKSGLNGFIITSGFTDSNNFPSVDPIAFSANFAGDAFVSVFRPLADRLHFSSPIGGIGAEEPGGLAQDAAGDIYITGRTNSGDFPVTGGAVDTTYNGGQSDAFVTRITNLNISDCASAVTPTGTTYPPAGGGGGVGVSGTCNWWAFSSVPWLTLASSAPLGTGTGALNYTVDGYNGIEPRTSSVQVAGNLIQVLQKGSTTLAPFNDVPYTDPFAEHIRIIKNNAVTSGCATNQYCPSENTTRGQMAVFIVRSILGTNNFLFTSTPYFTDVAATHPQFKWIQKLRELGITTGCDLINYCPNDPVTRGQMAVFLIRAKFGNNFTVPPTPYFQDVPANHPFFNFIQKLRQSGITTGCGGTQYCPNDNNTRGQMAVFLTRMFFTPW